MKLSKDQIIEIEEQQNQNNTTKRVTAPKLEEILYEALPILDHGFVRVVDYMGMILQLFICKSILWQGKKVSTDEGLFNLMRHWHAPI